MKMDQANGDTSDTLKGSGRGAESIRNAEPKPSEENLRQERPAQDDLILHDDDEAELDLPR